MADTRERAREMQAEGRMDRIRGRIRSTWGKVTDDDIDQSRGNMENLIGRIKERTGESVESIRGRLGRWMGEGEEETSGTGEQHRR